MAELLRRDYHTTEIRLNESESAILEDLHVDLGVASQDEIHYFQAVCGFGGSCFMRGLVEQADDGTSKLTVTCADATAADRCIYTDAHHIAALRIQRRIQTLTS